MSLTGPETALSAGTCCQREFGLTMIRLFCLLVGAKALLAQPEWRVQWSAYLPGNFADTARAVAVDREGGLWIAGSSYSVFDAPGPNNPIQRSPRGQSDIFVARYVIGRDGRPTLDYWTWLGGSNNDELRAMAIGENGRIYLTGTTDSSDFPLGGEAFQNQPAGAGDGFLAIIDPTIEGEFGLVYCTYFGGNKRDEPNAIAVDPKGRVAVVGTTNSDTLPNISGGAQASLRGAFDAFLLVFDLADNSRYVTFLGGRGNDNATGVAFDAQGQVWFSGSTGSDDFPVTNDGFRQLPSVFFDGFLARINPSVNGLDGLTYATFFGGSGTDVPTALARDANGHLWISGHTNSADLPTSANAFQRTFGGNTDMFLLRFDPELPPANSLAFSSYFGGVGAEIAYGLAVANGRVALTGYTMFGGLPVTTNAAQTSPASSFPDSFVAVFDVAAGRPEYVSYLGGAFTDVGLSVAIDRDGAVQLVGYSNSADFPVTDGSQRSGPAGSPSAVITRYVP